MGSTPAPTVTQPRVHLLSAFSLLCLTPHSCIRLPGITPQNCLDETLPSGSVPEEPNQDRDADRFGGRGKEETAAVEP